MTDTGKPTLLIRALKGERGERVPFWYMRQAGRYLPEYRDIRARLGGFWDLVFTPEMAAEVTLQPVRRFDLDAAILFSDILVIPFALGQKVTFIEKRGPILDPLDFSKPDLGLTFSRADESLAPIFQTLRLVKENLSKDKALIGFAGSPWTVATYMIESKGSPEKIKTRRFFAEEQAKGKALLSVLVEATVAYLDRQVEAGANVLQLFDTWAGALQGREFDSLCLEPTKKIVTRLKQKHPEVPVIGYAKGVGARAKLYFEATGIDAIGIDHAIDAAWAVKHLQQRGCVQGNLDPALVVQGGPAMLAAAENILQTFSNGPHAFNLGHGVTPDTPVEHVAALSDFVRAWRG